MAVCSGNTSDVDVIGVAVVVSAFIGASDDVIGVAVVVSAFIGATADKLYISGATSNT